MTFKTFFNYYLLYYTRQFFTITLFLLTVPLNQNIFMNNLFYSETE